MSLPTFHPRPCSHLQQLLDDEISKEVLISKSRPFCHLPRPCGFRNRLVEKDFMEREFKGNAMGMHTMV